MKKKSQIRKYSVQKVNELTQTQTIPQMLKMYAQHVEQKKKKLQDKKKQLIGQLNKIRKQTQKVVFNMVDGVKDRIEKSQQIVMGVDSRPTKQDVQNLSELFTYMQNQNRLIKINSESSNKLFSQMDKINNNTTHSQADYTQLDETFARLQLECERQEIIRNQLKAQRDSNRDFYNTIKQTIAQYRIKYDIVEAQIAQRQKQLDHLVSYFNIRQQEDRQKIQKQLKVANQMEQQILTAQQMYNENSIKKLGLQMRQNQYYSRKQEGK